MIKKKKCVSVKMATQWLRENANKLLNAQKTVIGMDRNVFVKLDMFKKRMEHAVKSLSLLLNVFIIVISMVQNVFVMMDSLKFILEFVPLVLLFKLGMERNAHIALNVG